jgi:cysteine desulfurase
VIYCDYNATTPIRADVASELIKGILNASASPGNASSVHRGGREWRGRLEQARSKVARILGCEPREVCFTGSGSEADAIAVKGAFLARRDRSRRRIVTSRMEHPAVLSALQHLEPAGAQVTRVAPEKNGRLSVEAVAAELKQDVALCSVMWANNETGVLQPVAEIASLCRQRGIVFHTDAVQAAGKVPVSLRDVAADLLSISAHKFYGPAGVGALVVRRGIDVEALTPGHQEGGRRGGTQNVPYIEALASALEHTATELPQESARIRALRDRFETEVLGRIPDVRINGDGVPRVPNTSNIEFVGADGEALLIALDLEGICVSSGAACASGSLTPSHVLTAMGLSSSQAHGSLRFSFGAPTTEAEVGRVIEALVSHVPKARAAS